MIRTLAQFRSRLPYYSFESFEIMKITLSLSPAAQIETECLVAVVLDRTENATGPKRQDRRICLK